MMIIEGPHFTIRSVDEGSLPEILTVYRQCEDFLALGPVPRASAEMVLSDLALSRDMGASFCGVFVNGEMVGVVDFVLGGFEGDVQSAYLSLLMIAQAHRRKGIGRDIVTAVEAEILKDHRIRFIHAGVQVNNPDAIAFWRTLRYAIVGEPKLMPDTTTAVALRKDVIRIADHR